MKAADQLICPISEERLDENTARAAALMTVVWVAISLLVDGYWLMGILAVDFALRAFTAGTWSITRLLARRVVKALGLQAKPTPAAPKKFAAMLGLIFCLLTGLGLGLHLMLAAWAVAAALLACALLEGLAGFCVGCYVYTYAVLPFKSVLGN